MAGRKKYRKLSSLGKTSNQNRRVPPDLPKEVLEVIIGRLSLRDNVRASAVCRIWKAAAISVRVANKSPWLMLAPKRPGGVYGLYDPSQRKSYCVEFPELRGSRFSYAKDGWLLMYKPNTYRVFFFCPYTRERIKLPKLALPEQVAAFSVSPKAPSCLVFAVRNAEPATVDVSTCRPGQTEWTTINYQSNLVIYNSIWNKIVFCNNLFYCVCRYGWMGVYNPEASTWSVLSASPPGYYDPFHNLHRLRGKFIAEHNGDMYFIHTSTGKPLIYKLDQTNQVWVGMVNLGSTTFFANFLCCQVRTDLLGEMRGRVYFPQVQFYGKRCVSYSIKQGRYYPGNQKYDWNQIEHFESIWIDAPEELPTFLQSWAATMRKTMVVFVIMMIV